MQTGWILASCRVTRQLAWDPTCFPLSLSFPIKNKQNLKVVNCRQHSKSIFRKLPSIQRVDWSVSLCMFIVYMIFLVFISDLVSSIIQPMNSCCSFSFSICFLLLFVVGLFLQSQLTTKSKTRRMIRKWCDKYLINTFEDIKHHSCLFVKVKLALRALVGQAWWALNTGYSLIHSKLYRKRL